MKQFKFKVSPLFLLFGILLILFRLETLFLFYFVSIFLHELGHAYVAKKLGYKLSAIKLMPYGTQLSLQEGIMNNKEDLLISLAGPCVNLLLIILTLALWWLFPTIYAYTEPFVISNLICLLFNLLPVFPLDGGRVILNLLSRKLERKTVYAILKISGDIISILFFLLFIISLFHTPNFTLIFIAFFLMASGFDIKEEIKYTNIFIMSVKPLKPKKTKEVKIKAVSENAPLLTGLKGLNASYFYLFYVLNKEGDIVNKITENELRKQVVNKNANVLFKEINKPI